MKLSIRICSPEDMDDLAMISRKTFRAAFEAQNNADDFEHYLNSALSKETLSSELRNPDSQFYFVFLDKDLVGFYKINKEKAQTDLRDPQSLELERIYVIPEYQKLGIGRVIVKDVIQKARDLNKAYVWLGVWEENKGAIAFYESLGFIKFGKHPYYIGKDKQMDWMMKLDLS